LKKLLSIIIPVYGVERYIEECMRSIACQILQEVEVIIVNDGTQDRSIEIAKEVVSELSSELQNCFIFLNQENQGQSVARNYGILNSTGEFIGFIDPDDIIYKDYFTIILKEIERAESIDVIHINAYEISSNSSRLRELKICNNDDFYDLTDNKLVEIIEMDFWQPWFRIFNVKLKNDLIFTPNILLEDKFLFAYLYKEKIKKIRNINNNLVGYRVHSFSSLGNKDNLKKIMSSAKEGAEKYAHLNCLSMRLVFLSYLNLYISLNSNSRILGMKQNSNDIRKLSMIALKSNDLSFWKRVKFRFPTIYAFFRYMVRKLIRV